MRKISILGLLMLSSIFFLNSIAFAHCGICNQSLSYAQEEKSSDTIEGEIICLGCTLKKEQGAKAQCSIYGHINGLRTADGKIWTLLENDNSTNLINDHGLAGKIVEIKGRKLENANYIEVESYKILE